MDIEQRVTEGLQRIAEGIVFECGGIAEEPAGFTWEQVAFGDEDEYPSDTPVHQGQVYGSSDGPDLESIICNDVGLDVDETAKVLEEAWDLTYELEYMVNSMLERGYVFVDFNCIFYQLVEEAKPDADEC
jgi:hypothetical protein